MVFKISHAKEALEEHRPGKVKFKQCRQLANDTKLNDKFIVEQLHWA